MPIRDYSSPQKFLPAADLDPAFHLLIQLIKTSAFCGGRHIGLIPERAASPLLASGMLVRIELMFALRERDIDPLAGYVARVAGAVADRGARLEAAQQM
jgi:hypothetical protein